MNIIETGAVMDIIATAYPAWKPTPQAVQLWAEMFVEDNAAEVLRAVRTFIATDLKGFAPSIGQIRCLMSELEPDSAELTETEAWALVRKAVSNGIYGAITEFEELPPILQRVVGDPDQLTRWAMLEDGLDTVVASNVMRSYRALVQREKYEKAAPALPGVGQIFKQIGGNQ